MFRHPHHQKISLILDALDSELFINAGAHFGGGTLITLIHDEYRFSKDIDFICPVGKGYRSLRTVVADSNFQARGFFKHTDKLTFPRDIIANQYGIRFPVVVDGQPIKFEVVAEARIELETPQAFPWTTLPCLSVIDRFAEKLLANADRGMDESIKSRDLIDLAALRLGSPIPPLALSKADRAYPVIDPLKKSILKFQDSEVYRNKCFDALEISNRAMILNGLDLLAQDFDLSLDKQSSSHSTHI